MSNIALQRRKGTTVDHATFTGLIAEITVDTTKDTAVVHDGATAGGFPLAKELTLTNHLSAVNNPHSTTKTQVGLSAVDNTSDAAKPISILQHTTILSPLTAHTGNTSNPHSVTKTQVGLSAVDNISDAGKPVSILQHTTILSPLTAHVADTNNPHGVTKTQIGLSAVDNTSDAAKPISIVQHTTILSPLTAHIADTNNPHSVTKTQIGLSAVDNTSDADKPISTATAAAFETFTPQFSSITNVPDDYVESVFPSVSSVSLSAAVGNDITSISLHAGEWLVGGVAVFDVDVSATTTHFIAGASTTSETVPAYGQGAASHIGDVSTSDTDFALSIPTRRIVLVSTQNFYLVAEVGFSGGPVNAYGNIWARQIG